MYYTECPECGAALDPGEKCDCKKEADATAIATTSGDVNVKNTLNNYTKETEECQDVKSDTPGDTSGREIRQQRHTELPLYLL